MVLLNQEEITQEMFTMWHRKYAVVTYMKTTKDVQK